MTSPIQFSDKIGDSILVIGGENPEEFYVNLRQILTRDGADAIIQKYRERYDIEVVEVSNEPFPPYYNSSPQQHEQAVNLVQGQLGGREVQPQSAAPMCSHGPRAYKEGTGRKGAWKAWFCGASQNSPSKCDPIWL